MNNRPSVPIAPTEPLADGLARVRACLDARPECTIDCAECRRQLAVGVRWAKRPIPRMISQPLVSLGDDDHCRWCARPISARAQTLAPLAGFIAFARRLLDNRVAGRPHSIPTEAA